MEHRYRLFEDNTRSKTNDTKIQERKRKREGKAQ